MLFVGSCLDEDCNPGWGDCGRPLSSAPALGCVEDGDKVIYFVLWRRATGQTARGAKKIRDRVSKCKTKGDSSRYPLGDYPKTLDTMTRTICGASSLY